MHPLYLPKSSHWLDIKVFYIKLTNYEINGSTTTHNLTLTHIPLTPDTIIEVNGRRSSSYLECILKRERMDKKSEEATFVSTDSIKMSGHVRFEVHAREEMMLSGILELSNNRGTTGDIKKWSLKCGSSFLKGNRSFEVYIAACFNSHPIILTDILQKKKQLKLLLDSIPENDLTEKKTEVFCKDAVQISGYNKFANEYDLDVDYKSLYPRTQYYNEEDGELSWFNAGVRVGVGLGLGICLGIGVGVGLLVRTYQSTTRNFKKRLI